MQELTHTNDLLWLESVINYILVLKMRRPPKDAKYVYQILGGRKQIIAMKS
jgi:hypothetical protein